MLLGWGFDLSAISTADHVFVEVQITSSWGSKELHGTTLRIDPVHAVRVRYQPQLASIRIHTSRRLKVLGYKKTNEMKEVIQHASCTPGIICAERRWTSSRWHVGVTFEPEEDQLI